MFLDFALLAALVHQDNDQGDDCGEDQQGWERLNEPKEEALKEVCHTGEAVLERPSELLPVCQLGLDFGCVFLNFLEAEVYGAVADSAVPVVEVGLDAFDLVAEFSKAVFQEDDILN